MGNFFTVKERKSNYSKLKGDTLNAANCLSFPCATPQAIRTLKQEEKISAG